MRKKILIIEDDSDTAELLLVIMDMYNYEAILFHNVVHVNDISKMHPDLIILDHRLSDGLGGILCHKLKTTEHTKHIPILMVSATHQLQEIATKCGANGYIAKPFDIDDLGQKIGQLLAS